MKKAVRETVSKTMQGGQYSDNMRNTGRTTRMLMRALCAVASGKRVIIVGPNRSQVMYMQDVLKRAGLDQAAVQKSGAIRFSSLDGMPRLASAPWPRDVLCFYDHAARDEAREQSSQWQVIDALTAHGALAE